MLPLALNNPRLSQVSHFIIEDDKNHCGDSVRFGQDGAPRLRGSGAGGRGRPTGSPGPQGGLDPTRIVSLLAFDNTVLFLLL